VTEELAADRPAVLVVTADRGLRRRLAEVGPHVQLAGPTWLLDLLAQAEKTSSPST
jgi:hypothetical protein